MFSKLLQIMAPSSIAVDLGTANTRIYASGNGEMTEMPSLVSLGAGKITGNLDDYLDYINSKIGTKPLRGGVIVDLKNSIALLKPVLKKSRNFFKKSPVSLASAPTDTSEHERDLLRQALVHAGASHVSIIPEIWVAAVGADIDISRANAQLLIDIGDGVTDMAVFRDGGIIHTSSIRLACSDLQRAIRSAVMTKYKVQIYDRDAERLTGEISSILITHDINAETFEVSGIDIIKRKKVNFRVKKKDIVQAIEPVVNKIIKMIEVSLMRLPENIHAEIAETGICLTGGGACIEGIDKLIAFRTNMEVRIAPDPLHAVINGAIKTLATLNGRENGLANNIWPKLKAGSGHANYLKT